MLGADGTTDTIEGTTIHPIWSVDRDDWVPLGELQEGEQLLSAAGPATILTHQVLHRATPVYNIEVQGEHVYQVGALGLLVHNLCGGKHHMVLRSLGSLTPYGHKTLTQLSAGAHTAVHAALRSHLSSITKTLANGKVVDMLPRAFNSGAEVRRNFTRVERLKALAQFYKNYNGGQYMSNFISELRFATKNGWVR